MRCSTRLVTDENGDAISSQGYFAFGSERSGGPIPTDHSFTGQKVDRSGLLYYNARYYDPVLGVFVSPDAIVPDPENVFDYNLVNFSSIIRERRRISGFGD